MKNSTNLSSKLKLLALLWVFLLFLTPSLSVIQAQDCNTDTEAPTFPPGANVPDPSGVINFGDLVVTCASTFGGGSGQYVMGLTNVQDWSTEATPGTPWTDAVNNTYHGPGGSWNKTNMGEIFGVAFDVGGNIYATATSIYGPSGRDASNAGAIYKIDQLTGIPTLLLQLPNELGPMGADNNAGTGNYTISAPLIPTTDYPGLGNISYDVQHDQFFVSNLEDGKIYRMATDGTILSTFDPLTVDDGAAGIAPRGERVWGLNSWGEDANSVQLFYSIWGEDFGTQGAGENTIRSIMIDANGEFITNTDQYEFTNPDFSPFAISNPSFMLPFSSPVSDLIVSDDGLKLITAQRSMKGDTKTALAFSNQSAHRSRIVEYTRTTVGGAWTQSPIAKFRTGGNINAGGCCSGERANSVGGIDWGYSVIDETSGGTVGEEDLVWSTADFIAATTLVYGVQGIPSFGDTEVAQSTILGYGNINYKSLFGDVEVLQGFPGQISGCVDLTANAAPGCGGATVTYNVQATDDCSDVSISYSHAPGSVFPFGETTVIVTATDVAGNSSTCSFTVTVVDVEGPTISNCGSVTVDSDPGSCSATNVTLPQPTATDCGSATFTYSNNAPSTFPIGSTTYQWTVTDESGNSSICNATVNVNDASPDDDLDGFTVCQGDCDDDDDSIYPNAPELCDNKDNDCNNQTDDIITQNYYADLDGDGYGDIDSETFTCDPPVGYILVGGDCDDDDENINPGALEIPDNNIDDNCNNQTDEAGLLSNVPDAECYNLVYQEALGNTLTNASDYDVNNVAAYASYNYTRIGYYLELDHPTYGEQWIWVSMDDFTGGDETQIGFPIGYTHDVIVSNMDVASNVTGIVTGSAITTGNVEIWPSGYGTPPDGPAAGNTANVYDWDDTGFNANPGYGSFQVHNHGADQTLFAINRFTPNNSMEIGIGNAPFGNPDWTFANNGNQYTVKNFYVLISDGPCVAVNTPPIAVCQDITLSADANCQADGTIDNGSYDPNGDPVTITVSPEGPYAIGTTSVTLTITDGTETDQCSANLTVVDNQEPIATCQDFTVYLDANGNASISSTDIDNGSSDNCSGMNMTVSPSSFDCNDIGAVSNDYAVETDGVDEFLAMGDLDDALDFATQATYQVWMNPQAVFNTYQSYIEYNGLSTAGSGNGWFSMESGTGSSAGRIGIWVRNGNIQGNAYTVNNVISVNQWVNYTVVYDGTQTASQDRLKIYVNGVDQQLTYSGTAPTSLPEVGDFFLGAQTGNSQFANTQYDEVRIWNKALSSAEVTANWNQTISGNEDGLVAYYAFEDGPGSSTVTELTVREPSILTNMDPNTAWVPGAAGLNGALDNVTLTVTDGGGNSSTCTALVTVLDTISPVITCPAAITFATDAGTCTATNPAIGIATATDNCGNVTITNDAPAVFTLGSTTVTWTADDGNGNSVTCTQTVTVEDNTNPSISDCPSNISVNNDNGSCGAVVTWTEPTAMDNCAVTLSSATSCEYDEIQGSWSGDMDETGYGIYPFELDIDCSGVVTSNFPAFPCGGTWTYNGYDGTAYLFSEVIISGSGCASGGLYTVAPQGNDLYVTYGQGTYDNVLATATLSGTSTATGNYVSGDVFPFGTTTVTYTATDPAGNTDVCSFDVTVTDNENPVINCAAAVTISPDAGSCTATNPAIGMATAIDNCGNVTITNDAPVVFTLETTTVTWTADDGNGNSVTCTQTVTMIIPDNDRDGLCDDVDTDDDNDGVPDTDDDDPFDPFVCADADMDGCDDCSQTGPDNSGGSTTNDGPDADGDGLCDSGDSCPTDANNDVDGDGVCDCTVSGGASSQGNIYVAERGGFISKVDASGTRTVLANVGAADGIIFLDATTVIVSRFSNSGTTIQSFDLNTNTLTDIAALGGATQGMDYDDNGDLLVTNEGMKKIQRIDLATNAVTDIVTGLNRPIDVHFESTNTLLITEYNFGTIIRYDLTTNTSNTVASGMFRPTDIYSEGGDVYLVAENGGAVSRVDVSTGTRTVLATLPGGSFRAHGVAKDAAGNIFATNFSTGVIWKIDLSNNLTSFSTGHANPVFIDDDLNPFGGCAEEDNCPDMANADQLDTDGDGEGDVCDSDDDNDGVLDSDDDDPLNPFVCADADMDGCDDCSQTGADNSGGDVANDGTDTDGDGLCDSGDPDDDNDGCLDVDDPNPLVASTDADGDGVNEDCDICNGDDASGDTDGDGICNDIDPDDDNDGCLDADDANPLVASTDTDGDGVNEDCDICTGDDASGDTDGDGTCDDIDTDDDGDGCLDVDDPNPLVASTDADGDGVNEDCDICTGDDASGDTDGDGICDDIDECPTDPDNDIDGDNLCADVDNCPDIANENQNDYDCDGIGNACDVCFGDNTSGDTDGDGVCDDIDNCLNTANLDQLDADCDGVGDVCDVCDGGDDTVDNNGDGIPDCSQLLDMADYSEDWKCGNNNNKIKVCHVPPGNPENAHTICISYNALVAHFNNHEGDNVGPCSCDEPADVPDTDGDGILNDCDDCEGDNASGDLDGDGICNDLDTDDDGDGQPDENEIACGSDPLDANETCIEYCDSYGESTNYEWIESIAVNADENVSGNDGGYGDYTNTVFNVNTGNVSLNLTPGFAGNSYTEYWCVVIDYNHDGDFNDPGEVVYYNSSRYPINASFNIPADALEGPTTMRISMSYGAFAYPCDIFSEGEVEDYIINISFCDNITDGGSIGDDETLCDGVTDPAEITSVNDASGGTGTVEYLWLMNTTTSTPPTNGNMNGWVEIANSNSASYDPGPISETTWYLRCARQSGCFDYDGESNVVEKTLTVTCTPDYCDNQGGSTNYEWIKKVKLGSINNNSGNDNGYGDYTHLSTSYEAGQQQTIILKPGFSNGSYLEYWRVWIDWNQDGDFDDSGEKEVQGYGYGNVYGNISVPMSAMAGNTRMRVAMAYGGYPWPCESFSEGEVEDYTIHVINNGADNIVGDPNTNEIDAPQTRSQVGLSGLVLYPNPAIDQVTLNFDSKSNSKVLVIVSDAMGNEMRTERLEANQGRNKYFLDINEYKIGVYFIHLQVGAEKYIKKFIKMDTY